METSLSLTAVQAKDRNFAMDVMRGVAVLGILLMNIPGFSVDGFYLFWGDALAGRLTLDGFVYKSALLIFDGRMRGLFTLLFGAGILLFIENKRSNSIQVADAYFRRMTWLLVFGILDAYVLLWLGDILFEYALCGIFIYVFRHTRVRYLLLLSVVCLSLFTFVEDKEMRDFTDHAEQYFETEALLKKGKAPDAEQKKVHDDFQFLLGHFIPFSDTVIRDMSRELSESLLVHRSGYATIFEKHAEETYDYQSKVFYTIFGETFGTILLGMALFKIGFFHGRLSRRVYWAISIAGIILGWALIAVYMKCLARSQAELWQAYHAHVQLYLHWFMQAGRILCTVGYAAMIYLLAQVKALRKFLSFFANVGRMALTNYIMQTVICSLYFFGFGLGHYGEYRATGLFVFVACIWVLQIVYSSIYLRYFQMGPVEWLWKRLTYGKPGARELNLHPSET